MMKAFLGGSLLCLFAAVSASADSIPTYFETGSFTLIGNNACGGPCVETMNFSFTATFAPFADPGFFVATVTNFVFTTTGPMTLTLVNSGNVLSAPDNESYIAFSPNAQFSSEVDLDVGPSLIAPGAAFLPLGYTGSRAFSCDGSDTMCQNFLNSPSDFGHISATLVSIPEPSSLLLLLAGFLAIGMLLRLSRTSE